MPNYILTDKKLHDMFAEDAETNKALFRVSVGFIITFSLVLGTCVLLYHLNLVSFDIYLAVIAAAPLALVMYGGFSLLFYSQWKFLEEMAENHLQWKEYAQYFETAETNK